MIGNLFQMNDVTVYFSCSYQW